MVSAGVPKPAANAHFVLTDWTGPGYVAGYLAAKFSKTGKVGFVGGALIPPTIQGRAGFTAGAKAANPKIKVATVIVGSFIDPQKAKAASAAQIASGTDVLYAFLDTGFAGLLKAIQESGKDVKSIGVILPQCSVSPTVIADTLSNIPQLIVNTVFGLLIAAASRSLTSELGKMSPDTVRIFRKVLPNFDLTSAGGFLQLVFVQLGFIVIGFAASALVGGWASNETSGRLEMLLTTPLARARWAVSGAVGVYLAIAAMTVVLAAGVGIGALAAGSDAATPMLGSITLGLYAAAVAGFGFAVGGLFRTSIAAEVVALVVVATFLIDLVAPALKLPDWVHQLALTAHLGQPMVGVWDGAGIAACLVLAAGGAALGGWGMRRRDVAR